MDLLNLKKAAFKRRHIFSFHQEQLEEDVDWWSKFYASLEDYDKCGDYISRGYDKLMVWSNLAWLFKCVHSFHFQCSKPRIGFIFKVYLLLETVPDGPQSILGSISKDDGNGNVNDDTRRQ